MADPTPAPAPAPAPAPSPAPAPAPALFDWKASGLDADNLGYVQNKGFATPADAITSYRHLETLLGAPKDQIIRLPTDDKPEAWNPVYDRLGRPKDAADYKLPVPQGADDAFAKTAASWFHENGLNTKQAQGLAGKWNEYAVTQRAANETATNERHGAEIAALKTEWGAAFTENSAVVDRAAQAFGMTTEHLAGLKSAMGPAAAMKFLHAIGSKVATDDSFVGGGTRSNTFGALTPAAAQSRIAELRADTAWTAKYVSGDREARMEMDRLHRFAYPS